MSQIGALFASELRIESLDQELSLISTVSLEPEALPLDVKVVLVGERLLYYLLNQYDPDFGQLFKIAADFEDSVLRNDDNQTLYARMIATRAGRVPEKIQEAIQPGTLLIATDGERVGQINGLSVSNAGQMSFGHATRITARVRLGKGEVKDIQREVKLAGPISSKAVMTLTGYLGAHYAPDFPSGGRDAGIRTDLRRHRGRLRHRGGTVRPALRPGGGADQAVSGRDRLGQPVRRRPGHRRCQ